jgi:hypothetical protein
VPTLGGLKRGTHQHGRDLFGAGLRPHCPVDAARRTSLRRSQQNHQRAPEFRIGRSTLRRAIRSTNSSPEPEEQAHSERMSHRAHTGLCRRVGSRSSPFRASSVLFLRRPRPSRCKRSFRRHGTSWTCPLTSCLRAVFSCAVRSSHDIIARPSRSTAPAHWVARRRGAAPGVSVPVKACQTIALGASAGTGDDPAGSSPGAAACPSGQKRNPMTRRPSTATGAKKFPESGDGPPEMLLLRDRRRPPDQRGIEWRACGQRRAAPRCRSAPPLSAGGWTKPTTPVSRANRFGSRPSQFDAAPSVHAEFYAEFPAEINGGSLDFSKARRRRSPCGAVGLCVALRGT